jgi:hypothetical protein
MISDSPGFPCPKCTRWFPITVHHLLRQRRFFCMSCGLELHLNGEQPSVRNIEALENAGKLPPVR